MAGRLKMIITAGMIVVVALAVAMWMGSRRQHAKLSAQVDHLIRTGAAPGADIQRDTHGLDTVPAPVSRYLRWALRTQKHIQQVRIGQIGTLRTDVGSDRWMPFEAEYIVVSRPIGFVWNARVEVAPLMHVRVVDSLIDGRGSGQVSLLSAFTVASDV